MEDHAESPKMSLRALFVLVATLCPGCGAGTAAIASGGSSGSGNNAPTLVEFVLSLPEDFLIGSDGTTKRVFRAAMHGIVPEPILERRDKIGFATPELQWLTTLRPWVDDTLDAERLRRVPALDLVAIRRHWADVVARRTPFDMRVWRWVNVVRWAERFGVEF